MKKINLILAATLFVFFVLVLQFTSAVDFGGEISEEDQETFDQILVPVMKIYNLIKYAATAIAALVFLIAGVNYMLSGSDPKKRDNAKNTAMYVILGLLVIWAAPLVVSFIVG